MLSLRCNRRSTVIYLTLLLAIPVSCASNRDPETGLHRPAANELPAESSARGHQAAPQNPVLHQEWWPVELDSTLDFAEMGSASLTLRSEGETPCGGQVFLAIEFRVSVYRDTILGPRPPDCNWYTMGNFEGIIVSLNRPRVTHEWLAVFDNHFDGRRDDFGPEPTIISYANGYESVRAIAYNVEAASFEVIVPGGLW